MQKFSIRIKPEQFKEWNERMVKKYNPDSYHHHHNRFVRFIESKRVKSIFKLIDVDKNDRVLEIGCGAGNVIEKSTAGKLFGMDISPSILSKAKQKLNKRVHLFQADAQHLPCKDQIFMQVICSEVLEHLLNPSAAISELARILNKQGITIISIPNESMINRIKNSLIRLGLFKWLLQKKGDYSEMPERMEDEWHLHTLNLQEWLNLFRQSFLVIKVKKIPFPFLPLRYVIRLEKKEK